jgi:hypothetical protein
MKTAILIIFLLANGTEVDMISDSETCFLAHVMFSEDALWVEDEAHNIPRQKAKGVRCACAVVGEL